MHAATVQFYLIILLVSEGGESFVVIGLPKLILVFKHKLTVKQQSTPCMLTTFSQSYTIMDYNYNPE